MLSPPGPVDPRLRFAESGEGGGGRGEKADEEEEDEKGEEEGKIRYDDKGHWNKKHIGSRV